MVVHDSIGDDVKNELMKAGAVIIDELRPENEARIYELLNVVKGSLGV